MRITDADIALAERLADAAGAAIRPYFRAKFDVETKEDQSPVTVADRAAEQAMRALLAAEAPRDGIAGEEFGTSEGSTGRQWVLDPIDGTRAFIAGRPLFGTLIALVIDGWPAIGVIDQPILQGTLGRRDRPTDAVKRRARRNARVPRPQGRAARHHLPRVLWRRRTPRVRTSRRHGPLDHPRRRLLQLRRGCVGPPRHRGRKPAQTPRLRGFGPRG